MVSKSHAKRRQDIKTKLMAAIAMLLVSSIMMVSSTYAWFTLSTAPEVTGISTQVGANGNLEMALIKDLRANDFGITSGVGDSSAVVGKNIKETNVTWGNLVDVSDNAAYGLDKITLYPSALNLTDGGKIDAAAGVLKTPEYGADGRVTELKANTVTGVYNNGSFVQDNNVGVRAIGVASGMTEREFAHRSALAAANSAKDMAKNTIVQSLTTNGKGLADIAMKRGLGGESEKYTAAEFAPVKAAVNDLTTVLGQIEKAYMNYILVVAASEKGGDTDAAWTTVKGLVEKEGATLASVTAGLTDLEVEIPDKLNTAFTAYASLKTAVNNAVAALPTDAESYEWSDISGVFEKLLDTSKMTVNGLTISDVMDNKQLLIDSYFATNSITLTMTQGSGVYTDIADHVGDYSASIKMSVTYNGLDLNNVPATMVADGGQNPAYLPGIDSVVRGFNVPSGSSGNKPMTDFYGYILDLAFRTNAANSNLLLEQEGVDRIYGDNNNEDTMGKGSSMTFSSLDASFPVDSMKQLMRAIKIVFFNPQDGTIYCYGGLNVDAATTGAEGTTANIYLYKKVEASTTYTKAEGLTAFADGVEYYTLEGTNYVKAESFVDGTVYYTAVSTPAGETPITDNKLFALTQNAAHALSVLVYLDGNLVGNDDVATAALSMTGSMNLQFASDANLVPMEYADLHTVETVDMTGVTATGATVSSARFSGNKISFKLTNGEGAEITSGTVKVNVTGVTGELTATYASGVWSVTAPKGTELSATTVVTVTYTAPAAG